MEISQPERFELTVVGDGFSIVAPGGGANFRGPAACRCPKIYIISSGEEVPMYIGATVQSMRTRLRQGWDATGVTGYYGYRWRNSSTPLNLDIFYLQNCPEAEWQRQMETVEAEVAFLVRCAGQWPIAQTEIHFYPSAEVHREIARKIAGHYPGLRTKLNC